MGSYRSNTERNENGLGRKRNKGVHVWMTKDEKARLKALAESKKLNLTDCINMLVNAAIQKSV